MMKKSKIFLVGLLASAFALSGCGSLLESLPGGDLIKKLDFLNLMQDEEPTDGANNNEGENNNNNNGGENNNNNGGENNNNNSGNNNNNGGGTIDDTSTLLGQLKAQARSIAAKLTGKSEANITFAEFEDESAEADAYYYDSANLTFTLAGIYEETYEVGIVDRIKGYLPAGAVKTVDNNEDYSEYGMMFFDVYYTAGEFTYNIYGEAYEADDEYPAETSVCVYIYKTSQEAAFEAYIYEEE